MKRGIEMKLEKWNAKAEKILEDFCAHDTHEKYSWAYANTDGGVIFCNPAGTWAMFCPDNQVVSAHPYRHMDFLRRYWQENVLDANGILVKTVTPGTFSGDKCKIIELARADGLRVYLQQKFYKLFPANALFYTVAPDKPVIVGLWENDRLHIIGCVQPIRKLNKVFEAA
jgi:hypothetical protein